MSVGVVVPAAGRGERLGAGLPKALRPVAGVPLLVHAVRALAAAPSVAAVVVAAPPDDLQTVRDVLDAAGVRPDVLVVVVAGGESRQDSVALGLAALPPDVDVVLVHDAARALVPAQLVEDVVAAVRAGADAVVPTVAVHDTVRRVDLTDGGASVVVDRATLRGVQTPQGFPRARLESAHARARLEGGAATDDAALVERDGGLVVLVPGSEEAFKVTHPLDLVLAEALLAQRGGS